MLNEFLYYRSFHKAQAINYADCIALLSATTNSAIYAAFLGHKNLDAKALFSLVLSGKKRLCTPSFQKAVCDREERYTGTTGSQQDLTDGLHITAVPDRSSSATGALNDGTQQQSSAPEHNSVVQYDSKNPPGSF